MSQQEHFNQARTLVSNYGQEHLLCFIDELPQAEQKFLISQILSVDFSELARLHKQLVAGNSQENVAEVFEPLQARNWDACAINERAAMCNQGMRALREGKVAAFLVAGGQGTRLGHAGPKGVFDIGLPSHKSLFQIQAERLRSLSRQSGKVIPWYIMTSIENHAETVAYFTEHNWFEIPQSEIFFFQQGEMPLVDEQGRILLASKGRLAMGANGNGGCFLALSKSGALEDMRRRGVEYVFVYSVDNALVRICDPRFLGYAIQSGLPIASKAVVKATPGEKVGVLCRRNGRPSILEYSEMTEDMMTAKDSHGMPLYTSANIAVHLFTRTFLERHCAASLPFHLAHKRIPFIDSKGVLVNPATPNAYKFEMFMFDLFPLAEDMAALLVKREEEFAPVKNKDGVDSPTSARELILNLHHSWALAAGLTEDELRNKILEISPLVSYAGEGIDPALIRSQSGNSSILVG